ncbi:short chain dehydrogenase [Iodidimonas gelatinilytica]|uniref:Short chain dehydrogenase n=1 Tax=Iodidimonas gelatinilytica TaxID=1236966 RepID=A0A5A7MSY6_9PROT|nr:SDR family oxidoreductase [Iodidimonas gelatinilytica]GEQ97989.1 short chain dehydrogenase [Iodidimonas gelatinilytica]
MIETILITGAGKRIGRAMALGLAKAGHKIVVHYHRSAADADHLVKEIRAHGGTAHAIGADLYDETALDRLIDDAAVQAGPISCLINNASTFLNDDLLSANRESWDQHMQVNLRAPFVLTQKFAAQLPPAMAGSVLNVIDHRVWKLNPLFSTYTLSKAALWTFTQTAAQALAPRIRVNAVGPGPVLPSTHQSAEDFAKEAASVPLGHGPSLDEFVKAVQFLLDASSITGQMIALDGGQHLAWRTADVDASKG